MSIKISISGVRLGADAEQRYTPKGDSVVSFRVACNSGYGDRERTEWFGCSIFGRRGESVLPYLKKGTFLANVTGSFSTSEGKDGNSYMNVNVDDLTLAPRSIAQGDAKPAANENTGFRDRKPSDEVPAGAFEDDDIPF